MSRFNAAIWYALQTVIADAALPPDAQPELYAQPTDGWIEVRIRSASRGMVTIGRIRSAELDLVAARLTDAEYAAWEAHRQSARADAFDLIVPYAAELEARRVAPLEAKAKHKDAKIDRARQLQSEGLSVNAIARKMLAEGAIRSRKTDDGERLENARRTVRRWLGETKPDRSRTVT